MRLRQAGVWGLFIVTLALAGSVATATAAPIGPWVLPASNLSTPGESALKPKVAVAPNGTATAVWTYPSGGLYPVAQAATRPPDVGFGAPVDLVTGGQGTMDTVVATGADGTTAVGWRRHNGSKWAAQVAVREPGASFGPAEDLTPDPFTTSSNVDLAVGPDGTVTAVLTNGDSPNYGVQATTRPPGGSFDTPVDLSAPGAYVDTAPQVATTPDGTTTAIWSEAESGNRTIRAATRQSSGSFGTPVVLSEADADNIELDLAAGADNSATAVWKHGGTIQAAWTEQAPVPDPGPDPKPVVPVNPPNDNTAIYDPATGKLRIRLKCGPQYKPKCLTMIARAVTKTGKKAKVMSSQIKVKNRRAGKWGFATLKIKPKFRQQVRNMGKKKAKTLWVRIGLTFKKKGKKQNKTVHHRYRVMVRG